MKKLYLTHTLFTALFLLVSVSCYAWTTVTIDGLNYKLSDGTASVDRNRGITGTIVIPGKVTYNGTDYSVTSIGGSAFIGCSGLTSVTIPNSVTSIGNRAFSQCTGLTSVTIPNSVTSIGGSAFDDTPFYDNQPDGMVCLGKVAYQYKGTPASDFSVEIPDGIVSISQNAFSECTGLTSVTISNSVTSIGEFAFGGCTGLTSVTIPNSVTSVDPNAFRDCTGLTSVTISNSVTSIGNSAFEGCTGLTSVTIPSSVTSIGNSAFKSCTGLTSVTIPSSVTSIGNSAFGDCMGLTSVTIPDAVTSIGDFAFSDCTGLTSVTVPDSVTSIGDRAFEGTPFYNSLPDGMVYLGKAAYKYKGTPASDFSVEIPDGIVSISPSAFGLCTGLTSVTIPNSVTSIGNSAFEGCTGLTSVTIPNSVTSIGNFVFEGCTGLTSVTIPNSVTSIENGTFNDCTGLTSVTIPDAVTSIGNWTFKGCTGLTSVTIPNSVTSLGYSVFSGCSGLTSVTIPNSVTSIGGYSFDNTPFYNNLPDGMVCLGKVAYQYKGTPASDFSVEIPDGIVSISSGAFKDCTGLTSVTIPNSVTSIYINAFSGCTKLAKITTYITDPSKVYTHTYAFIYVKKDTCKLYVPQGTAALYKAAEVWKDFQNILEMGEVTDINSITESATNLIAHVSGSTITLSGLNDNESASFYTTGGMLIGKAASAGGEAAFNTGLNNQVIIVKIGSRSVEVAVK